MPSPYASFPYDLVPADKAAYLLQSELQAAHALVSKVSVQADVAVLLVEGMLVVYGHSSKWHWWSGQKDEAGRWVWNTAPITNAGASARLIAERFTQLLAAQPHEARRR
ncbi:hypothetical protein ACFWYW_23740 [Nonomuraea sp. NPDC059023]|uniref:hypothetical protein n=1 Tax=unclassified Nonomuraea TaxID=2593643 RepID=UPI0036812B70